MKKKKNIRMYQVLAIAIVLSLVVGFNIVQAQDSANEASTLDKIIEILKFTKVQESTPAPELGTALQNGEFIVTKLIDMDDITTTGVDVTNQATGDFYIDNVIIETSDHNIASGTLFKIETDGDTYGASTTVFSIGIPYMASSTSWDLNSLTVDPTNDSTVVRQFLAPPSDSAYTVLASSTQRVILEDSAKLVAKCTGSDCKRNTGHGESGTGYVRITTFLKKVNTWSNIYE